MYTTQFTRRFSAAHRLADDPGVCSRIHGHNYEAEIIVECDVLGENNMIIPAERVKFVVDQRYDHRLILDKNDPHRPNFPSSWVCTVPGAPSTEFLAACIAEDVANAAWEFLGGYTSMDLGYVQVTCLLRETPTIKAVGHAEIRNEL